MEISEKLFETMLNICVAVCGVSGILFLIFINIIHCRRKHNQYVSHYLKETPYVLTTIYFVSLFGIYIFDIIFKAVR